MTSPLLQFLIKARSTLLHLSNSSPSPPFTLVLGNPSCDLDSFISATVYSFFHSRFNRHSQSSHLYIPILNLPTTPSSELWRLRPEFGTALRLALHGQETSESDGAEDVDKGLLGNLISISDIRSTPSSSVHYVFSGQSPPTSTKQSEKVPVVLVDHNALSIPIPDFPISESSNLNIVGCIDHHNDESYVPTGASPRIIRTGIGSCTSLVIQYLREERYWEDLTDATTESEDGEDDIVARELAKLSLASILIDTANLTAEGRVSDTDREVVSFLESIIKATSTSSTSSISAQKPQQAPWDRDGFYDQISTSKANSLDLLTLPEIFERDYKSWTEKTTSSGSTLNLGIASVVKPINWLLENPADASAEKFVVAMEELTKGQSLDVLVVMTAFSSMSSEHGGEGQFTRELLVLEMDEKEEEAKESQKVVDIFQEMAKEELDLGEWTEDASLLGLLGREQDGERKRKGRIWWQRDVSKSRKQVAPLVREAMRRA